MVLKRVQQAAENRICKIYCVSESLFAFISYRSVRVARLVHLLLFDYDLQSLVDFTIGNPEIGQIRNSSRVRRFCAFSALLGVAFLYRYQVGTISVYSFLLCEIIFQLLSEMKFAIFKIAYFNS